MSASVTLAEARVFLLTVAQLQGDTIAGNCFRVVLDALKDVERMDLLQQWVRDEYSNDDLNVDEIKYWYWHEAQKTPLRDKIDAIEADALKDKSTTDAEPTP